MFDARTLISTRETAAGLMARREIPWNRVAGAVEEKDSALRLLEQFDDNASERLFEVERRQVTLDQLQDWVHAWENEGINLRLTATGASVSSACSRSGWWYSTRCAP